MRILVTSRYGTWAGDVGGTWRVTFSFVGPDAVGFGDEDSH
jgi:hypothetical protein